nr:MAG TPA_asm: hypothetical protein [Caudoviricetes sp.]
MIILEGNRLLRRRSGERQYWFDDHLIKTKNYYIILL